MLYALIVVCVSITFTTKSPGAAACRRNPGLGHFRCIDIWSSLGQNAEAAHRPVCLHRLPLLFYLRINYACAQMWDIRAVQHARDDCPPWLLSYFTILVHYNQQYCHSRWCVQTCFGQHAAGRRFADDDEAEGELLGTVNGSMAAQACGSECHEQSNRDPDILKLVFLNIALSAMRGTLNRITLMDSHARLWGSWRSRSVTVNDGPLLSACC